MTVRGVTFRERSVCKFEGGLARAQCNLLALGVYSGGSEDTPESLSRQRADAMLSDGRAGNHVFGEYVKKIVGKNAISLRL